MGFRAGIFLLIPIVVLLFGAVLTVGATNPGPPNVTGPNPATFCSPGGACATVGPTTYYCNSTLINPLGWCRILPSCNIVPTSPAFCVTNIVQAIYYQCFTQFVSGGSAACGVIMNAGDIATISSTAVNGDLTASAAIFGFAINGGQAFIAMIGIAVGLISLASLTFFGSGMQGEGLHILFMGGMLLGFWILLSAVEGFIAGNPNSMFSQLNGWASGTGTFIYVGLTLCYTLGFVGAVSRGS